MTGSATRQSFSRVITARAERRHDEVVVVSEQDGIPLIAAVVDIGDATNIQRYARTRLSAGERRARIDMTRTPLRNQAGKVRRSTFPNPHHRRYTAKV